MKKYNKNPEIEGSIIERYIFQPLIVGELKVVKRADWEGRV